MNPIAAAGLVVAAASLAPLIAARGGTRRLIAISSTAITALALALVNTLPRLGIGIDLELCAAIVAAVQVAVACSILAARSESGEVALTPARAAAFAGVLYLAMVPFALRVAIDGDEPYYLLTTESLVRDRDLDLRNQYAHLESSKTGRTDLAPQLGDPVGANGEQYSRHEPLLAVLLIPGYLAGGLSGAVATIAIFGALAVFSIMLLLRDEGISRRATAVVFPFFALAPPLLVYATRIWPEAVAALAFSEGVRSARHDRKWTLAFWALAISLLKFRFAPVAAALLVAWFLGQGFSKRRVLILAGVIAIPLALAALFFPGLMEARAFDPTSVFTAGNFTKGLAGILIDAQAGLLFQAPLLFAGLGALFFWRSLPAGARLAALSAIPYILLLAPRSEWHGGWSPPLRYLVVFMPLFAILAAVAVEKLLTRGIVAAAAIWTAALAIHGLAYPDQLFQLATGESLLGRRLSSIHEIDFSRLLPSLIRPNGAAVWFAVLVAAAAVTLFAMRSKGLAGAGGTGAAAAILCVLIAAGWLAAQTPGTVVELEDQHVRHEGGSIYPDTWTVARFRFRGGWLLRQGDSLSFKFAGGPSELSYNTGTPATLDIEGRIVELVPTNGAYGLADVELPRGTSALKMTCVKGEVIVDRISTK